MHIEACILTSPRPTSTFYATLHSMARAGFKMPLVMDGLPDGESPSSRFASLAILEIMRLTLERCPAMEMLLITQDDVEFSLGSCDYLTNHVYPFLESSVYSIYTPSAYSENHKPGRTWHLERKGELLVGGIACMYPRGVIKRILKSVDTAKIKYGFDREIGIWAREHGHKVWYHEPSLVQHTGMDGNSALGHTFGDSIGRASTYKENRDDYIADCAYAQ